MVMLMLIVTNNYDGNVNKQLCVNVNVKVN